MTYFPESAAVFTAQMAEEQPERVEKLRAAGVPVVILPRHEIILRRADDVRPV